MQGSVVQSTHHDLIARQSRSCPAQFTAFLPRKASWSGRSGVLVRVAQPSVSTTRSLESAILLEREQARAEMEEQEVSANSNSTTSDIDGEELAVELARIANDVKGEEISVLHVAPLVYWTSYLLLVTVNSRPQLQAVIARMERRAKELGRESSFVSRGRSAWEVLDFGDVVVHIFTPDQREYYDLESFYGAAEEIPLLFLTEERRAPDWASNLR
ncbi:probable ribosomal silencing factor RsfS at C-terminar half [Coccomyxa sp. Obi]|nr:probable ribosomal silencing factor RsfS at C-terminar half [Coccomyxa sp. Obi]